MGTVETFGFRLLKLSPLVALAIGFAGTAPHASARGAAGTLAGHVTVVDADGDRVRNAHVAIYLEGGPERAVRAAPVTRRIQQRDQQFSPQFMVVPEGSTVDFPNQDRIFHNVFSLSRTRRFDLGLYKSGSSKSVVFPRAGVVDIYCNIHPHMIAHILVLETAHYAMVGRDGSYRIPNVPAGTYQAVGWQRYGDERREEVTIKPNHTTSLNLRLVAGENQARHLRKDGTAYGRYR